MAFDLHKLCFINAASRYHSPPVKQSAVRKHDNSGRSRPLYLESKELPHGSFHAEKAPEPPPAFLRLAISIILCD